MKKSIALIVSVVMAITLCFSGCGSSGGTTVAGETQTSGNIKILVPDGMKLTGGSIVDNDAPDVLTLSDSEDAMKYIMVSIKDEESIDDGLDSTKEVNSSSTMNDCNMELSNGTFTGFSYDYSGTPVTALKGKLSSGFVQIGSYKFETDNDTFKAVLESIEIVSNS